MSKRRKSESREQRTIVPEADNDVALSRVETVPGEVIDLYLPEELAAMPTALPALSMPDFQRCQCEWPDTSVTTFGPKPVLRCDAIPTVLAFQRRSSDETPTATVALCSAHRILIEHMYPGQCYFRTLTAEGVIGGFC